MLKATQILRSSCGFASQRLKLHGNCGLPAVVSLFTKQSPSSSSSRRPWPSSLPCAFSVPENRSFGALRMSSSLCESIPDETSSSSSTPSAAFQSTGNTSKINFCQLCGGSIKHEIPDGDEKLRAICTHCGRIAYENPKMVVGCLIEHDNKILLCKRKIQPSSGLWTFPAGYLEIGESAAEGAIRETWEEAGAKVEVLLPLTQLDIPLIGQMYLTFLAKLKSPHFSPGPETWECRLFAIDDIPFDYLAFSSNLITLNLYIEDMKAGRPKFHYATINKRPGTSPSDIRAYTLDCHLQQ